MDFGNTPKIAPASTIGLVPRSDVVAATGSVPVDLAPEKTVQSAQAGDAVRLDIRQQSSQDRREAVTERQADKRRDSDLRQQQDARTQDLKKVDVSDVIESRLTIEPRTRSIVLQKTNLETGETVQTLPDEATLKLRILNREFAERARAAREDAERSVELTA